MRKIRTLGIVTGSRSDFGTLAPIIRRVMATSGMRYCLYVTGMHLSPAFGNTVHEIEAQGFAIEALIDSLISSDSPQAIAKSMGIGTVGFAQVYAASRPDLLLVVGDRFETHAAVVAAVPFLIPVAHLHGGESTEGVIDEQIRHSITKMSHLHFVSTEYYGQRLIRMGEEPWRVCVSGAPTLDQLKTTPLLTAAEFEERVGMAVQPAPFLVTYHPVTLEFVDTRQQVENLLAALAHFDAPVILTYPNADTENGEIIAAMQRFVSSRPNARFFSNLGYQAYISAMQYAAVMVGNSSSGILEAASFKLPAVNIGNRQQGRLRTHNIIDVSYSAEEIRAGIGRALDPGFREGLQNLVNPYGDGRAAERIVRRLEEINLDQRLLAKRFYDGEVEGRRWA